MNAITCTLGWIRFGMPASSFMPWIYRDRSRRLLVLNWWRIVLAVEAAS